MLTFLIVCALDVHLAEKYRGQNVKITFQTTESPEIGSRNTTKQNEVRDSGRNRTYGVAYGQNPGENWIGGNRPVRDKGKTLADLQQEAGNIDASVQQDFRTVLSNTLSQEDYARLEKEGFDLSAMDADTVVTIVDKIKAELARSGQHIVGYTDDVDRDTLAAALGSETLAGAVADSFREEDVPLTEENIDSVRKAWDMAAQLEAPAEGSYHYMIDNEMEPEIWNFYLAQSSGAAKNSEEEQGNSKGQPRFYAEEIQGYYAETAKSGSDEKLQEEIDRILGRVGLSLNSENRQAAAELIAGGLPVTRENLEHLQKLRDVQFPISETTFAQAAATAVAEGKDPIYSNLAGTENVYEQAAKVLDYFSQDMNSIIDVENIVSRRQLEEIRLRMTAEVNVKLIKSGFAIDTASMEQLVEALRRVEAEIAEKYFPQDEEAVSKYELYRNTEETVAELPGLPAQLLGPWSVEERIGTVAEFHKEGKVLQETYERAQTSYETLMTTPRKDLGDSIRKAFGNVDDILRDMGLDTTEENRRAVRILGYNRMTVDAENISRVQSADEQVRAVVEKMTPASTLKMIRDGKNPLEMSFAELEEYFDSQSRTYEEKAESYSRFLYGLEQNKQITAQEREAFIGIYRMLHQIDASDGAAVGALVNVGAEIHFSNLLSAVRSGKFKSLDVSVTENFGTTMEVIRRGESITEQIAKGFVQNTNEILTTVSQTDETEEIYQQMELQQLREAATVSTDSVELLARGQLPMSAENLLAAQALVNNSYNPFREWKIKKAQMSNEDVETVTDDGKVGDNKDPEITGLLEKLSNKEEFQTSYHEMLNAMEQEIQEISLQQAEESVDVRGMALLHKQLSVAGSMAGQEEYIFPMYIGRELAKVHLTLDRDGEEKGMVSIAVAISEEERLEAHLYAGDGKITGFLVGNTDTAVTKLERTADIFIDSVQKDRSMEWEITGLPVVGKPENRMPHRRQTSVDREVPGGEVTHKEVNNSELYHIAHVFLEAIYEN